jgi:hypothetical protein
MPIQQNFPDCRVGAKWAIFLAEFDYVVIQYIGSAYSTIWFPFGLSLFQVFITYRTA